MQAQIYEQIYAIYQQNCKLDSNISGKETCKPRIMDYSFVAPVNQI